MQSGILKNEKDNVAGLYEASEIIYDGDKAVFQFVLHQESKGATYLIFLKYSAGEWKVDKIQQSLVGSNTPKLSTNPWIRFLQTNKGTFKGPNWLNQAREAYCNSK